VEIVVQMPSPAMWRGRTGDPEHEYHTIKNTHPDQGTPPHRPACTTTWGGDPSSSARRRGNHGSHGHTCHV